MRCMYAVGLHTVNVFYIGVSQDETWGAANVAPCHVKLNVARNTKRRVMNLKITRGSRKGARAKRRTRRREALTPTDGDGQRRERPFSLTEIIASLVYLHDERCG